MAHIQVRKLFNLYQPMEQFTPELGFVVVQFNQRPQNFEELIKPAGTRVDRDIAINMIRPLGQTNAQTVRLFLVRSGLMLLIGAVFGGGGAVLAASVLTDEFPNLLDSIVVICAAAGLWQVPLVRGRHANRRHYL